MEILHKKVFKCLAKELIQEKKNHSYYYKHLYRQGLFVVPGTATEEERVRQGVQEIAMEALKFASYTVVGLIKSDSPLKTLEMLYDLLGALRKAFLLNIKVSNNRKVLEEICYWEEMALQRPLREFRVELRDQCSITSCKLNALPSVGGANSSETLTAKELPTSSRKRSPSPSPSSSSGMFEDIYFGKTLAESGIKPKKVRKKNCHPATILHILTESSSEGESGETPEIVGL